jgi:hypothetical protein
LQTSCPTIQFDREHLMLLIMLDCYVITIHSFIILK